MNQLKSWIGPTLVTLILAIFVISSALFYNQVQDELRTKESSIVAKAIALNLVNEIKSIARALSGLSQMETANAENKIELYNKIAKGLIERNPGFFYGINFINAQGIIEKIYPVEENQLALGRNLNERHELTEYLQKSIATHSAQMSHRVPTYQGVHAIIIYEPLYNEKKEFKGWVNAVIDIDYWLQEQLKNEGWKDVYLHLHWDGHDESDLEIGETKAEQLFTYDFNVINQNIRMKVGLASNSLSSLHNRLLNVLELLGVFLLILVTFLLIKLTISQNNLITANQKLNLKNILLNSLAHDLATPLTSLGFILEAAINKKDSGLSETLKERGRKNLNTLIEMLASVRTLSRLELERQKFKTNPIRIKRAVETAVQSVSEIADKKKVKFEVLLEDEKLCAEADEATLLNNVLPNVLNNAIKFTKPDTKVTVSAVEDGPCICVEVVDQGTGFTEAEIQKFNSGHSLRSNVGTEGEVGSGLGLTQVKGFMELYGGTATLHNASSGALIRLKFKKGKPADN